MRFGFQYCTPHSEAGVIFISVDAWLQLPHCTICFTPEPLMVPRSRAQQWQAFPPRSRRQSLRRPRSSEDRRKINAEGRREFYSFVRNCRVEKYLFQHGSSTVRVNSLIATYQLLTNCPVGTESRLGPCMKCKHHFHPVSPKPNVLEVFLHGNSCWRRDSRLMRCHERLE